MSRYKAATDATLSARIRRSDAEAFKALYERYHDAIFGFLRRRLDSYELARDMTQDVFVRTWASRANLDPKQPVKAYLFRAANNLLINHYDKTRVRQSYAREYQRDTTPHIEPHELVDLDDHYKAALDALPPNLRTAFVLNRYDGLTYREIAAYTNVSVKTVESRMSKALKQLREALKHVIGSIILALIATIA